MTSPRIAVVTRGWIYAVGEWTAPVKVYDEKGCPQFDLVCRMFGICAQKLWYPINRSYTVRDSSGNSEPIQFLVDQPREAQEQ